MNWLLKLLMLLEWFKLIELEAGECVVVNILLTVVCWWISGCWCIKVVVPSDGRTIVSCGSSIREAAPGTEAIVAPVATIVVDWFSSVPFTTTTLFAPLVKFFIKLFCCNRVAILLWLLQYINVGAPASD